MTRWYEIRCTVPREEADDFAETLSGLTGNGTCSANLEVDTFDAAEIALPPLVTVTAYIESAGIPQTVLHAVETILEEISGRTGIPLPPPETSEVRDEDWANRWKEWFKPLRAGKKTVIKPTWEPFTPSAGEIVIELDPGQAFGTGTHETTRLCIELLEELVPGIPDCRVLDVGTGSGILAIAALRHGGVYAEGIDIDPQAIATASENASLNGVGDSTRFHTTPLQRIEGAYAVVVANILAEDLVRMKHDLDRLTASGGMLILSGILREKEEFVLKGFAGTSLEPVSSRTMGEWCAILFRKG